MHFFLKKVEELFQSSPSKHRPPTPLIVSLSNKTNKAVMIKFLFSVHTITEAKQFGRAEPGRWIFQPGDLTWRALV